MAVGKRLLDGPDAAARVRGVERLGAIGTSEASLATKFYTRPPAAARAAIAAQAARFGEAFGVPCAIAD